MFESPSAFFETLMLCCFGLGWPLSIYKSLKTRFVRGKSLMFMFVVLTGYAAGFSAKLCKAAATGEPLDKVSWLYLAIFCMVSTDIFLYFKFRHNQEAVTEELAREIAEMADDETHMPKETPSE